MLDRLAARGFEIKFVSHAAAILEKDFPSALDELESALGELTIPITEIIALGWKKFEFVVRKTINE
jgi:hypothetical protein